ncbi:MAG: hypothetical protein AB1646_23230 [Thermodesulfobacteriota bacterium]
MEYRHVNGPVYCRFASTPPIVNSPLAEQYGIEAPTDVDVDVVGCDTLKTGTDVKLRLLLDGRTKQMTCHAKIDYVMRDVAGGKTRIGFGQLSFSDKEFQKLIESFTEQAFEPVEITDRVEDKGLGARPVSQELDLSEATRIKAVTFPVALIDEIDSKRGDTPFSEFVADAVRRYMQPR